MVPFRQISNHFVVTRGTTASETHIECQNLHFFFMQQEGSRNTEPDIPMMITRRITTPTPMRMRIFMFFQYIWRRMPEAPFLNWTAPCSRSAKNSDRIKERWDDQDPASTLHHILQHVHFVSLLPSMPDLLVL